MVETRAPEPASEPAKTLMPTPVPVPTPGGNSLQILETSDPGEYMSIVINALVKLFEVQKPNGRVSREKVVDKGNILTQVQWDYLIGPAKPGTKQPGLFRQLNLFHEHGYFQWSLDVTCNTFAAWYLEKHGHLPAVDAEIKEFSPPVWARHHGIELDNNEPELEPELDLEEEEEEEEYTEDEEEYQEEKETDA